jgi:hypothetical protein
MPAMHKTMPMKEERGKTPCRCLFQTHEVKEKCKEERSVNAHNVKEGWRRQKKMKGKKGKGRREKNKTPPDASKIYTVKSYK